MGNESREYNIRRYYGAKAPKESLSEFSGDIQELKIIVVRLQAESRTLFIIESAKLEKWLAAARSAEQRRFAEDLRQQSKNLLYIRFPELENFVSKNKANKKLMRSAKKRIDNMNDELEELSNSLMLLRGKIQNTK
jgi:hypothetical protein